VNIKETEIILPGGRFVVPEASKQLNNPKAKTVVLQYEPLDQSIAWPGFNPALNKHFSNSIETVVIPDWFKQFEIRATTTRGDVSASFYDFLLILYHVCGYRMTEKYWESLRASRVQKQGAVLATVSDEEKLRLASFQWTQSSKNTSIISDRMAEYFATDIQGLVRPGIKEWWTNESIQQWVAFQYGTRFAEQLSFADIVQFVVQRFRMSNLRNMLSSKRFPFQPDLDLSQNLELVWWINYSSTEAMSTLYDVLPDEKVVHALLPGSVKQRITKDMFVKRALILVATPPENASAQRNKFWEIAMNLTAYRFAQGIIQSVLEQQDVEELQRRRVPLPPPFISMAIQTKKP
jgi:hypothetical protein